MFSGNRRCDLYLLTAHSAVLPSNPLLYASIYGVSAGKRDQIEFNFKKKFLNKIDVDLIIWSRTFIISKKIFLSIWSLFPALTPYVAVNVAASARSVRITDIFGVNARISFFDNKIHIILIQYR